MATGVFSTALLRAARAGTRVLEHSILTRAAARQPRSEWRHAVDAAYGAAVPAAFVAAGISVGNGYVRPILCQVVASGGGSLRNSATNPAAPKILGKTASTSTAGDLDLQMLWELIKPDILTLLAAVASAVGAALTNVHLSRSLGVLVTAVTNAAYSAATDNVIAQTAIQVLGLAGLQSFFTFGYITLLSITGERICERMRNELYRCLLYQDIAFFDERRTGEVLDRLTTDVDAFRSSFKQCVSLGLRNVTQALGSVVAMFMISRELATGVCVVVPAVISVGTCFGSLLRVQSSKAKQATTDAAATAGEVLGNIRTVRSFATEEHEAARFGALTATCRGLSTQLGLGIGLFAGLANLFTNAIVLSVVYFGGRLIEQKVVSTGELTSFLVSAQTIQRSVSGMSMVFGTAMRGSEAGARVFDYIKLAQLNGSSARTYDPSFSSGKTLPRVTGEVEFRDLTFAYPTRPEQRVLNGLSLKVPAGKVVALCGHSGAGKSTIAGMLERFYDPDGGEVLLDGHNIRDLDPQWLRREIGYINQEPVLFSGSVRDNICYGSEHAPEDAVVLAATRANAHTFIDVFPNGYDTVVGERGVTLSGGQKQRIAIARALLKNPRILLLDEATSALDAESERLVQAALSELTAGRTVLVIAHRLSTIQNADSIAVVHGGRVVEQGTHHELLSAQGSYARLVQHQLSTADDDSI